MLDIINHSGRAGAVCRCSICKGTYEIKDRHTAKTSVVGDQCPACKYLPKNPPTQALLLQVFNYDPATGLLAYKRDFAQRAKGADPTSLTSNGYLVVTLDKTYLAHRIIWLMQTGDFPEFVDHQNHTRTDNRWANLLDASRQENAQNKSVNKNNSTGYLGVAFHKGTGKFRAYLTKDRQQIHLGLFATAEDAHQARVAANKEHAYHENHGKH